MEWLMQRKCTTFNLRTAFISLITKMGTVDPIIYVRSEVTNEVWKAPNNIPAAAAFNNAFAVKQ
eukprot:12993318-Ditylum_brightwellii.AAC.1